MQSLPTSTHYVPFVAPTLLQHPTLGDSATLTAVVLLAHRNRESGLCYATQKIIALERGISDRAVRNDLTELRSHSLVSWETRKSPRGVAKGRGNLYDLSGLLDLCSAPMLTGSEVIARAASSGSSVPHQAQNKRKQRSGRERKQRSAHGEDFRAIEQQQIITTIGVELGEPSSPEVTDKKAVTASVDHGKAATLEPGDRKQRSAHAARIAKVGPLAGLTPSRIHEQRLAPNGESAFKAFVDADAWTEASRIVRACGGEDFNPGDLSKLCDEYGNEQVWYQAKWFPLRLAVRKEPPQKPTAFFVDCVRNDYNVSLAMIDDPAVQLRAAISALAPGGTADAELDDLVPF